MKTSKHLAIIPARGGSKGIPKKNIQPIMGKPLIVHTIEAALQAKAIDLVVVSTDDAEIAGVAAEAGAYIIQRPADISGDTASSESALLHALEYLREKENIEPETITFLQCTSPLTISEDIDGTFNLLQSQQADSALAVSRFFHFLWKHSEAGAVGVNHDKSFRLRRQDQEPQYLETGSVYVMKTEGFRQSKHRFFGKTAMFEIPAERVFEIDEPQDLNVAEALMQKFFTPAGAGLPEKIEAIVFDFDGVFTDNKVIVFQNGEEAVICDRGDGMGVSLLRSSGIPMWVISKEQNPVLKARCAKLQIECFHGVDNKLSMLKQQLQERNIDKQNVLFVGNDINDIECMQYVGCAVAVHDSHPTVFPYAKIVLEGNGGKGAIRELADRITDKLRKS